MKEENEVSENEVLENKVLENEVLENIVLIPLDEIFADESFNCRGKISQASVASLAESIEENGLRQAIEVHVYESEKYKYRITMGYRRFHAHELLGKKRIPAVIKPVKNIQEALILNFLENHERQDLNAMQEARALQHLFDAGMNDRQVKEKMGVSTGWLQIRKFALALSPDIQDMFESGELTSNGVRDLYTIRSNPDAQRKYIVKIRSIAKADKVAGRKKRDVRPSVKGKETKRKRSKTEAYALQKLIQDHFGFGIATRAIAWINGGITDGDVLDTLEAKCDEEGIEWNAPEDNLII